MPDVTMPQLGETVTEGTITKWYKAVGDQVARDEPLFEVSTDKVDSEVPSPAEGVLTAILVPEGDTVDVGVTLAVIGDEAVGQRHAAPAARRADPQPPAAGRDRPPTGGAGRTASRRPRPPPPAAARLPASEPHRRPVAPAPTPAAPPAPSPDPIGRTGWSSRRWCAG